MIRFVPWACLFMCSSLSLRGGTFSTDFESSPPGVRLFGNAMVNPAGGVNDSGVLRLTPTERERTGSFIVEDFNEGRPVSAFRVNFHLQIGGGGAIGADGISVNCASQLPNSIQESGVPRGLSLCFNTYIDQGKGAPNLHLKYNNKIIASAKVPGMRTPNRFVPVTISLEKRRVDVAFDGKTVFEGILIPNFKAIVGAEFGFGARTGSQFDNHLIDDLSIVTFSPGAVPPALASVKKAVPAMTERAWFVNGTEVLQGCIYKPRGDGPFPALIFTSAEPMQLPEEGAVNPCPELGALAATKGYALFLPGSYEFEGGDQLLKSQELHGNRLQSALAWLRAQSFVDPNKIVTVGAGPAAIGTLLGMSQETDVRGIAFLGPHGQGNMSARLRQMITAAMMKSKSAVYLAPPADSLRDDVSLLFTAAAENKAAVATVKISRHESSPRATTAWNDDLFSFLDDVMR